MKKNIVMGLALFLMSLLQLRAQDSTRVNPSAMRRFEESFQGARNVQWVALPKKVSQVQFVYQGGSWIAFFDRDGSLITSGRHIKTVDDLPLKVQSGLRRAKARMEKKWGALQVSLIYEMLKNENTRYYISVENTGAIATFSVDAEGMAVLEKKNFRTPAQKKGPKNIIARTN